MINYKALVTEEFEPNKYRSSIQSKIIDHIPEGFTLIKVEYSSLNYKDALSASGHKGISRFYPHTPGIDASGIIEFTTSDQLKVGAEVVVTGFDLGMNTNGGFGQYIVVPNDWVLNLPAGMTLKEAMIYGTAGFTAALSVYELIKHDISPDTGKILVTGATGGVGTMAVGILSKLGYSVTASTGKTENYNFLSSLGADEIINREELLESINKPLNSGRWAAVIENVGGVTLTNVIKSVKMHGSVCIIGNVTGDTFTSTVYPFLLRGIYLIGIDSASKPIKLKEIIWKNLAENWRFDKLHDVYREVDLDDLSSEIDLILKGGQLGRVVVKLW